MKIKTSELEGVALDWAVAKCEWYGDPYAATRRATVRAAAEIGKSL